MLRLTARPLAWAVRAEIMRNNLGQVDDYLTDFVREPRVARVLLIGKAGTVELATDRKLLTTPAENVVSRAVLETADVLVEQSKSTVRLAVPIMSFDERLGVLVVDYRVEPPPGTPAQPPAQPERREE